MNKAYKKVMENLSVKRKKQLQNAQGLWNKYRDANSNFYADTDSGILQR